MRGCLRAGLVVQLFWINPLAWAFRAAVLNEFQAEEYEDACGVAVAEGEACPKALGQVHNLYGEIVAIFFLCLLFHGWACRTRHHPVVVVDRCSHGVCDTDSASD